MRLDGVALFLRYAGAGRTVRRALRVALVVGPVLTLINQIHTIIALEFNLRFYLQTALTFSVPYMVSTHSSAMAELAAARTAAAHGAAHGAVQSTQAGAAEPIQ